MEYLGDKVLAKTGTWIVPHYMFRRLIYSTSQLFLFNPSILCELSVYRRCSRQAIDCPPPSRHFITISRNRSLYRNARNLSRIIVGWRLSLSPVGDSLLEFDLLVQQADAADQWGCRCCGGVRGLRAIPRSRQVCQKNTEHKNSKPADLVQVKSRWHGCGGRAVRLRCWSKISTRRFCLLADIR